VTRRKQRVDRWVEAVLDDQPLPEGKLADPDDVEALRAAIELRASQPAAGMPSDTFVARLRRQTNAAPEEEPTRTVSRRALLAGAVAAGAVAAGGAGIVADRTVIGPPARAAASGPLVPDRGQWVPVASEASIADGAIHRFTTPGVVGFVSERNGAVVAVSGVCTHLGCLLQPDPSAGRLDCPCHRTSFSYGGDVLFSQLSPQPVSLPQMKTRRVDGNVEAFVPEV
jgi:Rieske Fe-S protein